MLRTLTCGLLSSRSSLRTYIPPLNTYDITIYLNLIIKTWEMQLSNIFFILGILLYLISGIMVLIEMDFNVLIVAIATIFLALGFFDHSRLKFSRLYKRKMQ